MVVTKKVRNKFIFRIPMYRLGVKSPSITEIMNIGVWLGCQKSF